MLRQLISHRHVRLNCGPVPVASIRVRSGDTITLSEKGRGVPMVMEDASKLFNNSTPEWIAFGEAEATAFGDSTPRCEQGCRSRSRYSTWWKSYVVVIRFETVWATS
ncbi:MAG: hypothetical protein IPL58_15680 [Betaproteobacteria bacterium]|uniref:RNA-binding S4 domain-containing protein n=1 Tax=Candidatus Proximibacter danicus TaxID=2954365 RepID=A0A9D7PSJ0_9PROT|nr:hypothetical protein [Candidatus Proximibacter danicus]